ncbi:MAG: Nif3-like dinuclear metal center hexameric protein [Sphingomonadales bacterium]|nr:Nif3-like dinuclear metal center hexameric protein [Sphingomonadales bacterium]
MRGNELFALIERGLGPEAHRHRGVDAPARRDTAIAGGSYRAPGTLVDGFRAGDSDGEVRGVAVAARASTAVLRQAKALGANLVISRQAFLGDSLDRPVAQPEPALAEKLALIEAEGLMVLRLQDPRTSPAGRTITQALPRAIGLGPAHPGLNPADGLVCPCAATPIEHIARRIAAAIASSALRLVGDPALAVRGIAFATETNRPNALNPLLSRPDVNLLVAGEVHETETTAYVLDAIALGQPKALLLVGSIAMEEPSAKALAAWLKPQLAVPVAYVPSGMPLTEVS